MSLTFRIGMFLHHCLVSIASAVCTPNAAHTVCIDTGIGNSITVSSVIGKIVDVLLYWSGFVALTLFIIGGVMMIGSGGSDALLSSGKKIMKGALIGYAIVLGSWMILSTVLYFILF